ncbi:hypothetical protein SANA_14340 [Gottschalkiaceae bacterium SANA]|nr:hypothetical protein SANA_14340 [Gottschalkiaceae bacterium SANA]
MEVIIVPNAEDYYEESIQIFNESFLSKLGFISKSEELQVSLARDFGLIDIDVKDKEFVAVAEGKVMGLLTLVFEDQGKLELKPNISKGKLLKKYGLFGLIRGALLSMVFSYHPPKNELYIDSIGVSADARGRGVGTKLLEFAEELAHRKGCNTLSLHVMKENPKAKALYERLGYKVVSEDSFRWLKRVTGYSGAYHMIKSIL